jgi:iron complex outermembrane receptor protein
MDLPHQFEFDTGVRYVDAVPRVSAPSYVVMDVRLGWRPIRDLELSVAGQNLLEQRHREYAPDLIRIQRTEVEQSVYAKATWRF